MQDKKGKKKGKKDKKQDAAGAGTAAGQDTGSPGGPPSSSGGGQAKMHDSSATSQHEPLPSPDIVAIHARMRQLQNTHLTNLVAAMLVDEGRGDAFHKAMGPVKDTAFALQGQLSQLAEVLLRTPAVGAPAGVGRKKKKGAAAAEAAEAAAASATAQQPALPAAQHVAKLSKKLHMLSKEVQMMFITGTALMSEEDHPAIKSALSVLGVMAQKMNAEVATLQEAAEKLKAAEQLWAASGSPASTGPAAAAAQKDPAAAAKPSKKAEQAAAVQTQAAMPASITSGGGATGAAPPGAVSGPGVGKKLEIEEVSEDEEEEQEEGVDYSKFALNTAPIKVSCKGGKLPCQRKLVKGYEQRGKLLCQWKRVKG